MQNNTRELLNQYLSQAAKESGADQEERSFTMAPAAAERLIVRLRESAELMQRINIVPSITQEGIAGALVRGGAIAARTDTTKGPRKPRNVSIDPAPYRCERTEFDAELPYSVLDAWAQLPDFQQRLDDALAEQQALDQITIGFHGTHAAEETDREAYPLLQDVNAGWLHKIRTQAPSRVQAEAVIGPDGDYASLDALVYGAIQMLDPWQRKRPGLVVMLDRDLLHTKLLANVKGATDNMAELALTRILSSGLIAGLPIFDAPSFPDDTLLVTSLDNLSIYYQEQSQRRFINEDPAGDRLCHFMAQAEAYVVEDYGRAALIENITFAGGGD